MTSFPYRADLSGLHIYAASLAFSLGCRILEESRRRGGDRVKRYRKLYVVSTLKTETGLKSILDHRAKVTRVFDDECVRLFTRKRRAEEARLASSYRNSDKRKKETKRNVVVLVVVVVVSPVTLFFVVSRAPYNPRLYAVSQYYSSFVKIYFRS